MSAPKARACGVTTACGCRRKKREEARDLRISVAEAGGRVPLNVMDGNYLRAARRLPVVERQRRRAQDRLDAG